MLSKGERKRKNQPWPAGELYAGNRAKRRKAIESRVAKRKLARPLTLEERQIKNKKRREKWLAGAPARQAKREAGALKAAKKRTQRV